MPYDLGITLHFFHFELQHWYAHQFRGSPTAEHVKQATEEILNKYEIDKQHVQII